MEIRQLEHFVAVAEEHHFTRAAERLHLVQSSVSASIRALERDLGVPLFMRNTRRVDLTAGGRAFLVEARHVLATARTAKDAATSAEGLHSGTLRVGTLQRFPLVVDVPTLLGRFHHQHPDVEIQLFQANSDVLLEDIRHGNLDLVFTAVPDQPPKGMSIVQLAHCPLMFVCAPTHSLASRNQVALTELATEPFVELRPGMLGRTLVDDAFAAAHVVRRIAFEVNTTSTVVELVGRGLGIALVSCGFASGSAPVCYVPVTPPVPTWELGVATAGVAPASAAARALLALILDEFSGAIDANVAGGRETPFGGSGEGDRTGSRHNRRRPVAAPIREVNVQRRLINGTRPPM